MSLNFGQKRKDSYNNSSFLTRISPSSEMTSDIPFTGERRLPYLQSTIIKITDNNNTENNIQFNFYDTVISLNNALLVNACYYLKIKFGGNTIKSNNPDSLVFQPINVTVALQNDSSNYQQVIGIYSISVTNRNYYYDCVFSPNSIYNKIVFRLTRSNNGKDFNNNIEQYFQNIFVDTNNSSGSRYFPLLRYDLYKITNILEANNNNTDIGIPLKRIGIEGNVGLTMCINGEGIKIPPSGIFQINRDTYPIEFLGFAILPDSSESFILNYQY